MKSLFIVLLLFCCKSLALESKTVTCVPGQNIKEPAKEFAKKGYVTLTVDLYGGQEIYIYKNVGHAFANSDSPNYNKNAAIEANEWTYSYLKKHL